MTRAERDALARVRSCLPSMGDLRRAARVLGLRDLGGGRRELEEHVARALAAREQRALDLDAHWLDLRADLERAAAEAAAERWEAGVAWRALSGRP